ncbi:MAG: hypothetical protein ACR9NN_23440 [Nostochopsis sp.]
MKNQDSELLLLRRLEIGLHNVVLPQGALTGSNSPTRLAPKGMCGYFGIFQP